MKLNTKSLADVSLGTPLIAEGLYFVRIKPEAVKVEPNARKDGQVLKLTLQILNDSVKRYEDNEEVNNETHQMVLWHNISLTETYNDDGSTKYDPGKRLKELGIAIGKDEDFEDLETTDLEGATCKAQVRHKPKEGDYQAKNEIAKLLPITEADNFTEPPLG